MSGSQSLDVCRCLGGATSCHRLLRRAPTTACPCTCLHRPQQAHFTALELYRSRHHLALSKPHATCVSSTEAGLHEPYSAQHLPRAQAPVRRRDKPSVPAVPAKAVANGEAAPAPVPAPRKERSSLDDYVMVRNLESRAPGALRSILYSVLKQSPGKAELQMTCVAHRSLSAASPHPFATVAARTSCTGPLN